MKWSTSILSYNFHSNFQWTTLFWKLLFGNMEILFTQRYTSCIFSNWPAGAEYRHTNTSNISLWMTSTISLRNSSGSSVEWQACIPFEFSSIVLLHFSAEPGPQTLPQNVVASDDFFPESTISILNSSEKKRDKNQSKNIVTVKINWN